MKKILKVMLVSLVIALCAVPQEQAQASHAVGADIQVIQIGPLQYRIVLRFYRDCAGIPAPSSALITYSSAAMGLQGTATATLIAVLPNGLPNGSQIPLSPCIQPGVLTTCQGGTAYGVQEWHYEVIITLPMACPDWIFSYGVCCRNATVDNLSGAGGQAMTVFTSIDNVNIVNNSSPVFNTIPVNQFCVGNQFFYNQGAVDPDGDSLVYSLVPCLDGLNVPVMYGGGYTAAQPISSSSGVSIDPQTGLITFTPTMQMEAVLCVLVEEYRNGVLIGSVQRDIQISISGNCVPNPPISVKDTVNALGEEGINAYCGDTCIILALTENVQCGSIETNGSDFRALDPQGLPNPIFNLEPLNCANGFTDSIKVHFYKPLTFGTTFLWTKLGNDGNTLLSDCGTAMAEFDTIRIFVLDTITEPIIPDQLQLPCSFTDFTITTNQTMACNTFAPDASDFTLIDANGTIVPLSGAQGLGCSPSSPYVNQFNFTLSGGVPNVVNPLYLILGQGVDVNTIANQCMVFFPVGDTVAIINSSGSFPVDLGPDSTLCSNDTRPLLDAGIAGASYQWFIDGNALPDTTQTITATQTGNYSVVVSVRPDCAGGDTTYINIIQSPDPSLGPDLRICDGDPLPVLDASISGAIQYTWTLNGVPVGTNSSTLQATGDGTYIVIVDVGGACVGVDTLNLVIEPEVIVPLGNDVTICEDQDLTLDAGIAGASSYSWTKDGSLIAGNNQTILVSEAGTYAVEVTNALGCKGTASMTLTVEKYPAAPQILCQTESNGLFVYRWDPVPNVSGYEVSLDGGLTWIPANMTAGPESHSIADPPDGLIVRGVSAGMCNPGRVSEPAPCEVIIPNVISPNGDSKNDVLEIKNIGQYPNNKLMVFNRWGNEIYSASGYNNDWKAEDIPDGTYFYVLELTPNDTRRGTLSIIR